MAIYDKWLDGALARLGYTKARAARQPVSVLFGGETPAGAGMYNWSDWSDEQVERLAITSVWVYSDIAVISQTLSAAEFGVYQTGDEGEEEIQDHDFDKLLEWPNPHMDRQWLLDYTAWWYWLRGEAYWWLVPDNGGQLAQVWPIPASRMQPIPDAKAYISGYAYTSKKDGKAKRIPPEQVCFFRKPNPFSFHRGMSPISAYRRTLEADTSAAQWNRDTFDAGLTLKTLVSLPQETSRANFEMLKQEIIDELVVKKKRYFITRAGDVKVQEMSMTHEDAEYLAGRQFSRDEIDRVFGFPEGFWSVKANRANAEAARATVIENSIWPTATRFAAAITGQVIKPYYGDDLTGRFEDFRPRDRLLQVEERKVNWRVMTVNEARVNDLGLEPYPDELVGETLVPLAIAQKGGGGGGGMFGMTSPAEQMVPPSEEEATTEAKADLRRWRGIALRRFRDNGKARYDFESDYLPADLMADIKAALKVAESEEEVRAAFAAGFPESSTAHYHNRDWSAYP